MFLGRDFVSINKEEQVEWMVCHTLKPPASRQLGTLIPAHTCTHTGVEAIGVWCHDGCIQPRRAHRGLCRGKGGSKQTSWLRPHQHSHCYHTLVCVRVHTQSEITEDDDEVVSLIKVRQ